MANPHDIGIMKLKNELTYSNTVGKINLASIGYTLLENRSVFKIKISNN